MGMLPPPPWHWWVLHVLVLHTTAIPQPNLPMVIRNTKYKRLLIHSECFILIHFDQTSVNCSMDLMYINVCNIGSATSNTYTYIICFPITSSDRIHCRILYSSYRKEHTIGDISEFPPPLATKSLYLQVRRMTMKQLWTQSINMICFVQSLTREWHPIANVNGWNTEVLL